MLLANATSLPGIRRNKLEVSWQFCKIITRRFAQWLTADGFPSHHCAIPNTVRLQFRIICDEWKFPLTNTVRSSLLFRLQDT
jgi:hypothetical protein